MLLVVFGLDGITPWVVLILMLVLLAIGVMEYLGAFNRFSPKQQVDTAIGYQELSGMAGKNPSQDEVSRQVAALKLSKEEAQLLFNVFNSQEKANGGRNSAAWRQKVIIALQAWIASLTKEE
ncbi:hypothetical protein SAMN04488002_2731 [Litoreibacter janthinus]|uniref:Uncharacterized protein n=2 Tax=Litoreibacter janthinus TaxID=670154 RepID=A0A1I6HAN0_9RHOB|nr:hypothetical protein SAMN04488002_2731 [Litoreibacter janthinus]